MLQRILTLLMAMLLLAAPAYAEGTGSDALYLLVSRDAEGVETPLGSAVLFMDQTTLLTTVWAAQASGELYAVGAGGTLAIAQGTKPSAESELALLTLETASPAAPLTLGAVSPALTTLGFASSGDALVQPAAYLSYMPYGDIYTLLYTAPAALLPGCVLLDPSGGLAAITTATYVEGVNRYVAITADDINAEISAGEASTPEGVSWLTGFTVMPGAGSFTVDWSACDLTCDQEDCVIGLFFADTENPYFSFLTAEEEGSTQLCVTPGRTYSVWVQHGHGEISTAVQRPAEAAVTVTVPEAVPFDQYQYQDSEIYLGSVPASEAEAALTTKVAPMEAVTAATLSDPDMAIFLQAASSYTISETAEADLLVVLATPEGYTFDYLGLFIFDITLQDNDVWNVDVSPLFDDYLAFNETGMMASGDYTLSYYLDGALANQISWTLE